MAYISDFYITNICQRFLYNSFYEIFYIPSLTLHCCWELEGPVKSTTLTAVAYGSISVVDMDTKRN